jgi:hypothetical protein
MHPASAKLATRSAASPAPRRFSITSAIWRCASGRTRVYTVSVVCTLVWPSRADTQAMLTLPAFSNAVACE